jgi:peptide-methionine (S)-S-oxide reductase
MTRGMGQAFQSAGSAARQLAALAKKLATRLATRPAVTKVKKLAAFPTGGVTPAREQNRAGFTVTRAMAYPMVANPLPSRSRRAANPSTILLACAAIILVGTIGASRIGAGDTPGGTGTKNGGNPVSQDKTRIATFAGGCFWCMEPPFDKVDGVLSTISGYTGGRTVNPTYEEVSSGTTGHAESLQVTYDPSRVTYEKLLEVYWHNIDPLARDRQFCDVGEQYRSAIFYHDEEQKRLAEASKQELEKSGRFKQPIATQIVAATTFYPAEEYHQDYYKKNPIRYKFYRFNCGRDQRLQELWGTSEHP